MGYVHLLVFMHAGHRRASLAAFDNASFDASERRQCAPSNVAFSDCIQYIVPPRSKKLTTSPAHMNLSSHAMYELIFFWVLEDDGNSHLHHAKLRAGAGRARHGFDNGTVVIFLGLHDLEQERLEKATGGI